MTRGFGKGWQTPGLVAGRGCVCGGGLKGLWVPHFSCPGTPGFKRGPILRVACAGARAWRLGFSPPPRGMGGDVARLPVRASCFASLDAASSPGPPRVGSGPRVVPAARSSPHPGHPSEKDSLGEFLLQVDLVLLGCSCHLYLPATIVGSLLVLILKPSDLF